MNETAGSPSSAVDSPEYGGFWVRAGALIVDGILYSPIFMLSVWSFGRHREIYYATHVFNYLAWILLSICLVKWKGGSPGKLLFGLRIVAVDLKPIGWKEAWLRESVLLVSGIVSAMLYFSAVSKLSDAEFLGLDHERLWQRIDELGGIPLQVDVWFTYLWTASEMVILLTNRKRRALHDFIAGTVVVKRG